MIADALISLLAIVVFAVIARKVAVALFDSTVLNVLCTLFLFGLFSYGFQKTVGLKLNEFGKPKIDMEAEILKEPVMAAIKEKNPQDFSKLLKKMDELVQTYPNEPDKIVHHMTTYSIMLLPKYLSGGGDQEIAEFMKVNASNVGDIRRRKGGDACFYALFPTERWEVLSEPASAALSEQQRQAGSHAFAKLIRSYQANRPMPKREDAEPVLRGVLTKITHITPPPEKIYGKADRQQACDYALAFSQALLDNYSPKQIADVVRFNNR